jgi:hypothetical protein
MSTDRELVERAMADVEVRSVAVEEFHRRRHRRQRARRIRSSVLAVVVLVATVGALGVFGRDAGDELTTAEAPARDLRNAVDDLERGRYFVDPDGNPSTPLRVSFDVVAPGWSRWTGGATKASGDGLVRLTITAAPDADTGRCGPGSGGSAVGGSVEDLATALSELGALEVTAGPRELSVLGSRGVYLQLAVPGVFTGGEGSATAFMECETGELQGWIAPILDGAFHGYGGDVGRREDLWILDVDGTRLVLSTTVSPASPAVDVAELDAMLDSVHIER